MGNRGTFCGVESLTALDLPVARDLPRAGVVGLAGLLDEAAAGIVLAREDARLRASEPRARGDCPAGCHRGDCGAGDLKAARTDAASVRRVACDRDVVRARSRNLHGRTLLTAVPAAAVNRQQCGEADQRYARPAGRPRAVMGCRSAGDQVPPSMRAACLLKA